MAAAATGKKCDPGFNGTISKEGAATLEWNVVGDSVIVKDSFQYWVADNKCTDPNVPYCDGTECQLLGYGARADCGYDKPPCKIGQSCLAGRCEHNNFIKTCITNADCEGNGNSFKFCTEATKVCVLANRCLADADCGDNEKCDRTPPSWQCVEE